jgi:hypothetical protein
MSEVVNEYIFSSFKEYRDYIDAKPEDDWIMERFLNSGKTKIHQYIPIFVTQANADLVFREWHVVEETAMSIKDGVAFTVKIKATPDYPGADEIWFTGSGAIPFKSVGNAVEFDVPNARERAVAKAFATLGNLFGRNLNRSYMHKDKKRVVSNDYSLRRLVEEEAKSPKDEA